MKSAFARIDRCNRPYRPVGGFAFKLAASFASIRVNPRGHRGRVGPRIIGDDETFPCASFLAYSNCAALTGLRPSLPAVSPPDFLGACSLRNLRMARSYIIARPTHLSTTARICRLTREGDAMRLWEAVGSTHDFVISGRFSPFRSRVIQRA